MTERNRSERPCGPRELEPWLRVRQVELEWLDAQISAGVLRGSPADSGRGLRDRLERAQNKLELVLRTSGSARDRALSELQLARQELLNETRAVLRRRRRFENGDE